MREWTAQELSQIGKSDDLHISPFRDDGETYGTPTWIWSVVVEDALFVRAYYGHKSSWYQAALRQGAGRITVAGMALDVRFEQADDALSGKIDEAYRTKYHDSRYLNSMISSRSRSATVKIIPKV